MNTLILAAKIEALRGQLHAKIRAGHCAEDSETGDVNFCGECDWCLHILSDRALAAHNPDLSGDMSDIFRSLILQALNLVPQHFGSWHENAQHAVTAGRPEWAA